MPADLTITVRWPACECGHAPIDHAPRGGSCDSLVCGCMHYWPDGLARRTEPLLPPVDPADLEPPDIRI